MEILLVLLERLAPLQDLLGVLIMVAILQTLHYMLAAPLYNPVRPYVLGGIVVRLMMQAELVCLVLDRGLTLIKDRSHQLLIVPDILIIQLHSIILLAETLQGIFSH